MITYSLEAYIWCVCLSTFLISDRLGIYLAYLFVVDASIVQDSEQCNLELSHFISDKNVIVSIDLDIFKLILLLKKHCMTLKIKYSLCQGQKFTCENKKIVFSSKKYSYQLSLLSVTVV